MLSSLGSPLPQVKFCPTGGVSATNASDYLALNNVISVGGSWIAPKQMVNDGDWVGITGLCEEALKAIGGY